DFKEFRCGWEIAEKAMLEGGWDLIVLDEFCYAFWYDFLTFAEFERVLENKTSSLEVVITGRKAPRELIERADLVSEVRCVKHPFQKGISAREGIEF
ncbi:MAG: cob(I)yrinic acid a,c-diamide adenosyltransferase, partial [Candidatus Atribacteria bacterium]|nr:cob(I)yrinic acid a,c-diamide adenosyltransferase [Candidatus Atribacteria bacterium]MCD6350250.1 cob(I)yrinic acid a,c-diamide adenosyltransferase [Candidatus Atribacteria bacterium]